MIDLSIYFAFSVKQLSRKYFHSYFLQMLTSVTSVLSTKKNELTKLNDSQIECR